MGVAVRPYFLLGFAAGIAAVFFLFRVNLVEDATGCPEPNVTVHSYFSQKDFYEAAALPQAGPPADPVPAGLLVNHHLLAAGYIAEAFAAAATTAPRTVAVVTPDHFGNGRGAVTVGNVAFTTPYGELRSDGCAVRALARSGAAVEDEQVFGGEHGVTGLVGFIKRYLPNARIVPIAVRQDAPDRAAAGLAEALNEILPPGALVVGSFDFSHYLPKEVADFHDLRSRAAVPSFDYGSLENLDVDSAPGLAAVLRTLELRRAQAFTLQHAANSAELAGPQLETTSYLTGYFSPGPAARTVVPGTTLLVGDLPDPRGVGCSVWFKFLDRLFLGQGRVYVSGSPACAPGGVRSWDGDLVAGNLTVRREPGNSYGLRLDGNALTVVVPTARTPAEPALALGIAERDGSVTIYPFFITENAGQLKLAYGAAHAKMLVAFAVRSRGSSSFIEQLRNGAIQISNRK